MIRTAVLATLLTLLAGAAGGQAYTPPRTSYGAPDLEGVWTSKSFTGLQRPKAFKELVVPEGAADAWLAERRGRLIGERPPPKPGEADEDEADAAIGGVESEWYEMDDVGIARIDGQLRSSWLVDPADGRLPYNNLGRAARDAALRADETDFRGPEVRMPDERCLMGIGSTAGPPMLNTAQNGHYKIVQTPNEIAILVEMIHDVRIVRMNAKRSEARVHPWLGDSIGWWEGDTLVVETIDQNAGAAVRFASGGLLVISPAARITERFTRISQEQLKYEFTVDDAALYTRPWRAEMVMNATDAPIYEYACHEANYSLPNILRGARVQEREAAAKSKK